MRKWTKEKIIQALQEFYALNSRPPKAKDFVNNPQYPPQVTVTKLFKKWNYALTAAGIPPTRKCDYTKADFIALIRQEHAILGKPPSAKHFKSSSHLPSSSTIISHFGSWNSALKKAGVGINKKKIYQEEELRKAVEKFTEKNGRTPRVEDIDNWNGPSSTPFRRIHDKFSQALEKFGVKDPSLPPEKEKVISEIQSLAKRLGRTPLLRDLELEDYPYSLSTTVKKFNRKFSNVLKAAGFEENHKYWGEEEIIAAIKRLTQKLQRVPFLIEFSKYDDMPDPSTICRLGHYKEVLKKANIYPEIDHELWRRWERLVGDILVFLYKGVDVHPTKNFDGCPDYHIRSMNLVVDAMTTSYKAKQKESEIHRYMKPGCTLEFWCMHKIYEYQVEGLSYLYPDAIIFRIRNRKNGDNERMLELINRVENLARKELGFYTKRELIEILRNFHCSTGKIPRYVDLQKEPDLPQPQTYKRLFGSFIEAKRIAGFDEENRNKEESLQDFKDLVTSLQRIPSGKECDREHHKIYRNICKHYKTWNNGVRSAGYLPQKYITENEILEILVTVLNQSQRELTYTEYGKIYEKQKRYNWPAPYVITRMFGSFKLAIAKARTLQ